MTEKEKIETLIRSGETHTIELAVSMAFSMNIDIAAEKLLDLYHQLYPTTIYQQNKQKKITALLSMKAINLNDLFPKDLHRLPNLRSITFQGFSHFQLSCKPLWQLQQVEHLIFHGIELHDFGDRFQLLSQLKTIQLSYCKIQLLHRDFFKVPKLEKLCLQGQQLPPFLDRLFQIKTLHTLKIMDIKIDNIATEQLSQLDLLTSLELIRTGIKQTESRRLKKVLAKVQVTTLKK